MSRRGRHHPAPSPASRSGRVCDVPGVKDRARKSDSQDDGVDKDPLIAQRRVTDRVSTVR